MAGITIGPNEPLPRCALAIDNLSIKPENLFSHVMKELKDQTYAFLAIGCRKGREAEFHARIQNAGIDTTLRYLGSLGNRDVLLMAKLIDPVRAERLAGKAIEIVNREKLSRTPLTVSLLLSMLISTEHLLSAASETALLDAYVGTLLGRGDPHEDARFELDSGGRADMLASFAEKLVYVKSGSMSEASAVACFAEYFDLVGWRESPSDVVDNLQRRRILSKRNGQVSFAQNSYLYLFAAKKASDSVEFRSLLYGNMLYYGPIIHHYAALKRSDVEVLHQVARLLSLQGEVPESQDGTTFAEMDDDTAVITATSIEDIIEKLPFSRIPSNPNDANVGSNHSAEQATAMLDMFEVLERNMLADSDSDPFPLINTDDISPAERFAIVLSLASNVLRDSDLVKNAELKEAVLRRILVMWAKFAELLEIDPDFQEFTHLVSEKLESFMREDEAARDVLINRFRELWPTLVASDGIATTLMSRKLAQLLENCFSYPDFVADAGASIMGAMFAFNLHEPGWSRHFLTVQKQHPRVKAVHVILERIAFFAYYHAPLDPKDVRGLRDFLVNQLIDQISGVSGAVRKAQMEQLAQTLNRKRELARRRTTNELQSADGDN